MDTCKDLPETEIMAEYNRAEQLREIHRKKRELTAKKANGAIDKLLKRREPINFRRVAEVSGVSAATLYKHPEVRKRIEFLRQQTASLPTAADMKSNMSEESKDAVIAALKRKVKKLEDENMRLKGALRGQLSKEWERL